MKKRCGQIMIESIVAITVAMIGLLGVLTLLSRSLAIHHDTTQKFVATYLAAEGIETIKNIIDGSFAIGMPWTDIQNNLSDDTYELTFRSCDGLFPGSFSSCIGPGASDDAVRPLGGSMSARPLNFEPASGAYLYYGSGGGSGILLPTPFIRTVQISNLTDEIRVVSTIQWTARGKAEEVRVEDHFFNWRPLP